MRPFLAYTKLIKMHRKSRNMTRLPKIKTGTDQNRTNVLSPYVIGIVLQKR
jgi:hypothetical protein